MAPFRPTGRSNRSGRLNAENDPMEGLPVRQWRQSDGIFGLPPQEIVPQDKDCVFPEMSMPKDSHMLSEFTQRLLREARKPRYAKRKAETSTEEEKVDDDNETKERPTQVGWAAKKWSQTPRHAEEPDAQYLAKRRKGLPSTYLEAPVMVPQVATRTAKVRKLDAAGNATIYEVIVAETQVVEGEVKDEDVSMADAPTLAPGTVVEGIGIANAEGQVVANDLLQPTPHRRRKPPPPKRKGGPGRGKKKVMFQPAPANGTTAAPAEGTTAVAPTNGTDPSTQAPAAPDGMQVDGDDEEGDDGDDGDEGEDDGDDPEDGEMSGDETSAVQNSERATPTAPQITQTSEQTAPATAPLSETAPATSMDTALPAVSDNPVDGPASRPAEEATDVTIEDPPVQQDEPADVPAEEAASLPPVTTTPLVSEDLPQQSFPDSVAEGPTIALQEVSAATQDDPPDTVQNEPGTEAAEAPVAEEQAPAPLGPEEATEPQHSGDTAMVDVPSVQESIVDPPEPEQAEAPPEASPVEPAAQPVSVEGSVEAAASPPKEA